MCLTVWNDDVLHILLCEHDIFDKCKKEIISLLQVKILLLLDEDALSLCLLEWTLDEKCETIDNIPTNMMTAMTTVGRRGVWFNFLLTMFVKCVQ